MYQYRLVRVKNIYIYSAAKVHAVSWIQTVKFCTRLLCAIPKTSPVGFLFFFRIFRQLFLFGICDPP